MKRKAIVLLLIPVLGLISCGSEKTETVESKKTEKVWLNSLNKPSRLKNIKIKTE